MKIWIAVLLFFVLLIICSYVMGYSVSKWYENLKENNKYWIHVIDTFLFGFFAFVSLCSFVTIFILWSARYFSLTEKLDDI